MPVWDTAAIQNAFESKAKEWVEYSESASGKLRHAIILGVTLVCADLHQLAELIDAESFEVVLCHLITEKE